MSVLTTKRCTGCGEEKPLSDFYRRAASRDGLQPRCKNCDDARKKAEIAADPQRHARYVKASERRHPERVQRNRREAEYRHRHKVLARRAVNNAVYRGRLCKPDRCECCKEETPSRRLHAHHEDYERRYDVEWLCDKCHREEHVG